MGLRHHGFEFAGGAGGKVKALADPRVLQHYQRTLRRQLNLARAGLTLQWDNVNSFEVNDMVQSIVLQK